jgi:hypothetical protein
MYKLDNNNVDLNGVGFLASHEEHVEEAIDNRYDHGYYPRAEEMHIYKA